MLDHIWSVLCEQTLQNPKTGSMSYINTLDNLPIDSVNKETGDISIKPFLIATKWRKSTKDKVTLYLKVEMQGESDSPTMFFGPQKVDLGENLGLAVLNIEIAEMIVKTDSKYHTFEVMYKINKQRNYRSAAILPISISIENLNENKQSPLHV